MKKNDNTNQTKINTPAGKLAWPHISSVDYGTDNFPKPDGEYNTRLILSPSENVSKFLKSLDQLMDQARKKAEAELSKMTVPARKKIEMAGGIKPLAPYSEVFDPDTEEPTGEFEFRAKTKASGVSKKDNKKWHRKLAIFDAKGQPIPEGVEIWGGSTAVLAVTLEPYFVSGSGQYGLQKRLNAVQVLSLVSSGGNQNAETYGFSEHDGFDASTLAPHEKSEDYNLYEEDDATAF